MSGPHQEKPPRFGISDEERSNIVVSFIKAFLDSKVKFEPMEAEEFTGELLRAVKAQYGDDYTKVDPAQLAMILKMQILKLIEIIMGSQEADPQEKKKATNDLFGMIVSARLSDRIHGEFIGVSTYESRLKDAEDRIERLSALMQELQTGFRNLSGLSRGPQQP
jgi:hypothetical protein